MSYLLMMRLKHPLLAGALLASFLFVSVGLTGQSAAHTLHHEHAQHQAATHASVLCSWVCSAGQVLEAFELTVTAPVLTLFRLDSHVPVTVYSFQPWTPSSRAPPAFSLQ